MFLPNADSNTLVAAVREMDVKSTDLILFLMGENCGIDSNDLISVLNQLDIRFMGGFFPFVIYKDITDDKGIIIKKIPATTPVLKITSQTPTPQELMDLQFDNKQHTALVLTDGISPDVSNHLSLLYTYLGNSVQYVGGGTASLKQPHSHCLFCNEGTFKDTTLVCITNKKVGLGVRHGWSKVGGPFIATKSKQSSILELNWEDAFKVYQKSLLELGTPPFEKDNFFKVAKKYPFGIYRENKEYIVRDAFQVTQEGHLKCVGDIPENTLLDLLTGDCNSLIEASREAARDCIQEMESADDILVFDCMSRALFMNENFKQELSKTQEQISRVFPHIALEGALSIGEIASVGQGYLELLNKTIVLGLF